MRIHSITMMLVWNGMLFANVFFHQNNPDWPVEMALSDMMYGTLIMLVVVFFTYFFWKAVSDTRDLHVQVHHVHEDVRIMERDMYEHSLGGWGSMLLIWFSATFISAWSGVNFVASRNNEAYFTLIVHVLTGVMLIPLILMLIWYPQRMLGTGTKISTSAALTAEIEMNQEQLNISTDAKCPECSAPVKLSMELDGQISVPCPEEGCETKTASSVQYVQAVTKNSHHDLIANHVTPIFHTLIRYRTRRHGDVFSSARGLSDLKGRQCSSISG